MKTPLVTVVIPTHNRKTLLPRALESVLRQTEGDFEIVIVDDGSHDGTEEMIRSTYRDPKIRYERFPENRGVHAARNRGIDLARGEYVAFLDSDDEWYPHALARGLQVMQDSSIGMIGAPFVMGNGKLSGRVRGDCEVPFLEQLCGEGTGEKKTGFTMLRRSAIGDIRWRVPYLQFIFFRRVAAHTRTWYIAEPLGIYHFDPLDKASVTSRRNIPNVPLSIARGRELVAFIEEFDPQLRVSCPRMLGYYAYGATIGLLLDKKSWHARRLAWLGFRCQPRPRYAALFLFSLVPFSGSLLRLLFALKEAFWRNTK